MPRKSPLVEELSRFDAKLPVEDAWTPPSSWYTAPEVLALERRAVFARTWQPVCRVADVITPGSYQSGCLLGEPWLVVRGHDGELRAFSNTCRHKGREVVTGAGTAEQLVCGYHGWSYGLDGTLRSAPRVAGIRGFDRELMSLPRLGVDVWGPWVFVCASRDAAPVAALCPEIDARLRARGFDGLVLRGERSWDVACNWKVYVDNYLDGGYHIAHMHPTLDAQLDMSTYRTELFARSSIQSARSAAGLGEEPANPRIGEGALYAWLYPAFMVNRYGPCLDTNYVVPVAPDRCKVVYELWFSQDVDDAFVAHSMAQADLTQQEDIEICESVQRGLSSSSYDRGRYAPRVEAADHAFHRLLAADLNAGGPVSTPRQSS